HETLLVYWSYGVASPAFNYAGKSLEQLSAEGAACLAALPKRPNQYHPRRHPAAALARRNWVPGAMHSNRPSADEQDEAARARPPVTREAPRRGQYQDADFFVEEARRRAFGMFGEDINAGGYYMRTTLDPSLQTAARMALMQGLEDYDRRHGWRGAWGNVDIEDGWKDEASEQSAPPERRE